MDLALSAFLGIGLAAAVGFRIFLPFLIISLAAQFELLQLSSGFEWIGTNTAMVLFGTASVIELLAYYIPWFDNLLDAITAPAAIICGSLIMASAMVEIEPWIKWTLAIIAGGGTAGLIKGTSSTTRAVSSVTTAGLGNSLIATIEVLGSIGLSLLSVFIPLLALLVVLYLTYKILSRAKTLP
ncbi:MAG: hypothetical protein DHS20C17_31820 [Cyclobacteriaceae bacterium]|nr:MAG: hypothetical protein DHS20C17_31820 [Cyclobacteriaceae bacterium]